MASRLSPAAVLYGGGPPLPRLSACEHYAGAEKLIEKALALQEELCDNNGRPLFDVTADCEDGAPVGRELDHARMIADLVMSARNPHQRLGARIHDVGHPLWREEVDILVGQAGLRLAYLVLPKVEGVADVERLAQAVKAACQQHGIQRAIPLHVLIETPAALHDAWRIAGKPQVETLDFGLMDFVSAHHGAIPASAMASPRQFDHPLIRRAKLEIATAALGNGRIPAHNVTTELRDAAVVREDARRARAEFGYLRMWSIHPAQIKPIIEAMQPDFHEIEEASAILSAAQDAQWGPIQLDGRLHDRASYRYYWDLLTRAQATGAQLNEIARRWFAQA